jgi:hypothetical protein
MRRLAYRLGRWWGRVVLSARLGFRDGMGEPFR